jgi:hypothetical protein
MGEDRRGRGIVSPSSRVGRRRAFFALVAALSIVAGVVGARAGGSQGASTSSKYYDVDSSSWTCNKEYGSADKPYRVRAIDVTTDTSAPVVLEKGCTGWVDLTVATASQNMVKMEDGVKNLTITGTLACAGRTSGAQQSGIQASGGQNVTISAVVSCDFINQGGVSIAEGSDVQTPPSNIVCDTCTILPLETAAVLLGSSANSGVTHSTLYRGTNPVAAPSNCVAVNDTGTASGVVDQNNSCLGDPPPPSEPVSEANGAGQLVH